MKRFLWMMMAAVATGGASVIEGADIPKFRAVDVDRKVEIGYGLAIADVDGDGKQDILLADKNLIVWYRNPDWKKSVMAERLTQLDHVCIAAADVNGDGRAEVAVGAGWNPGDTVNSGAVFYLVAPADRTQKWEAIQLPHEPTVHRMRWVKNNNGKFELVVVPLHGRGNKAGQGEGVRILAYHMPEDPKGKWTTTQLDGSLHQTHNFNPVQWDNDAGHEMLVAAKEGVFLLNNDLGQIKKRPIGGLGQAGFPGAGEVRDGKLPNGKRFVATVEPMHGNQVAIYTEPTDAERIWPRLVIDDTLVDGHAVGCGDLLKIGHDQLVVGWRAMNKAGTKVGIKMYVPDAAGQKWTTHLIDDNTMACEDLLLADLDGNGRLDIVAAGRATKNLKVYFNDK